MASCLHELLQHLEISGDFFSATRPFHLVGFGNGANIAATFASLHGHRVETYCLRSLVLLNGFASLDAELTANLTSAENVFQCLPSDKPELARDYFKQYLLSRDYVDRVGKDMAWNLLTAISNPISMAGRLLILKGAMLHVDLTSSKTNLKACRGIPMIVVHSTENKLVSSSHVSRLIEGRNVKHIYAHEQTSVEGITNESKRLVENVLRSSDGNRNRAAVLWFKCGHQISIEAKKKLIDLFRSLAQSVSNFEEEVKEEISDEESEKLRRKKEQEKELKDLTAKDSKRFDNVSKREIEQDYQSTKHQYDQESKLEALLRGENDVEEEQEEIETTLHVNVADDIKTRLEKKLEEFEQQKAIRAKTLREQYEAQTEKLRESSEIRREEWESEDTARLDALEVALEERRKEREAEELNRSQRIEHYNLKRKDNNDVCVVNSEEKDMKSEVQKPITTARTKTETIKPSTLILDQLEAEDKKKEENRHAERVAAAEEEERKREEFEKVRSVRAQKYQ